MRLVTTFFFVGCLRGPPTRRGAAFFALADEMCNRQVFRLRHSLIKGWTMTLSDGGWLTTPTTCMMSIT